MKCMIVAYDKNRAIGKAGDLPWRRKLKTDLRRFKTLTLGNSVVMGRKTFDSIGFALPGRENIVVSRQDVSLPENVILAHTIDEAYQVASRDIYVIGGAMLYEQTLPDMDKVFSTEVDAAIDGTDTFFPELDHTMWYETDRQHQEADENNGYSFDFVTYERRS